MKISLAIHPSRDTSIIWDFLAGCLILAGLYLASQYSFLLFHSLAEIFTIVIAFGIFILAWNTRLILDNQYIFMIGSAYLFVGILDLLHTLTYEGMGVVPVDSPNLATQFWVASRYLQSLSLLAAPFFIHRKPGHRAVMLVYAAVTLLLVGTILEGHIFPVCYIPGVGLTPFKRASEIAVIIIFLAAIGLTWQKRSEFEPYIFRLLVISILLNICAEVFFSMYMSVFSLYNLIGHFFRFAAYFVIYKGIIQTGFLRPYDLLFHNLKQHEKALWDQTLELQMRNEDLDAYAHTVAHDLKNPLSGMISLTNALQIQELDDRERPHLYAVLQETAFGMKSIIDNLLLFAEVRKSEAPLERLDMEKILRQAANRLAALIQEKQAVLIIPSDWPAALGYAQWIEEVWVNYLCNALKFGGDKPEIEFGAEQQTDGQLRFWIRDHGCGLSPEEQARLFTPFDRLAQTGGHGLGLSIVRRIVEKLGGQAGVESEAGKGSTFFFTLQEDDSEQIEW